jgi:hypothetical protein
MNILSKIKQAVTPKAKSADDIAADAESKRVADQVTDTRLSQRSGTAGENYQSGRATK